MPITHDEIIEDLEGHIQKLGGERSGWCVGTAKDARAPFFRRHLAADVGDGLIYREAFTTTAADQVIDHLVNHAGLYLDRDSGPESGKIVFVYRPTVSGQECTGQERTSGHFRFEAVSPEAMTGTIDVTVTNGARTMTIKRVMHGKWLGADCGSLKNAGD